MSDNEIAAPGDADLADTRTAADRVLDACESRYVPLAPDLDAIEAHLEVGLHSTWEAQAQSYKSIAQELLSEVRRLRAGPAEGTWQPIEVEPTARFLLLTGTNRDGTRWRNVGVYQGSDEAGRHFVDGYGAGSHPTHWMPLPAAPESKEKA